MFDLISQPDTDGRQQPPMELIHGEIVCLGPDGESAITTGPDYWVRLGELPNRVDGEPAEFTPHSPDRIVRATHKAEVELSTHLLPLDTPVNVWRTWDHTNTPRYIIMSSAFLLASLFFIGSAASACDTQVADGAAILNCGQWVKIPVSEPADSGMSHHGFAMYNGKLYSIGIFGLGPENVSATLIWWDDTNTRWVAVTGHELEEGYAILVADLNDGNGEQLFFAGRASIGHATKAVYHYDGETMISMDIPATGTPHVYCLIIWQGSLVAGGNWSGGSFMSIGRWAGSSWEAIASSMGGSNPTVQAMTLHDDGTGHGEELCVTGRFIEAGGISAKNAAACQGSAWRALGDGITVTSVGQVRAICSFANNDGDNWLYAGGDEYTQGEPLLVWDGITWRDIGLDLVNLDYYGAAECHGLTVFEDKLVVVGLYHRRDAKVGMSDLLRIGKHDLVPDTEYEDLSGGFNGAVHKILILPDGTELAFGDFTASGDNGISMAHAAKRNGGDWSQYAGGIGDRIFAAARMNGLTYAGGDLNYLARSDDVTWADAGSFDRPILDIVPNAEGTEIVILGSFSKAFGQFGYGCICHYDGVTPTAWATEITSSLGEPTIYAGCWAGEHFYVTGSFDSIDGVPANNIAYRVAGQWHACLEGLGAPGTSICYFGGYVYVGYGASPWIKRWYPVFISPSWSSAGFTMEPDSPPETMLAFDAGDGEALYVGAHARLWQPSMPPPERYGVWKRLSSGDWSLVGDDDGELSDAVLCLAYGDDGSGDAMHVGGRFLRAGEPTGEALTPEMLIAAYDASGWSHIAGGLGVDPVQEGVLPGPEYGLCADVIAYGDRRAESLAVGGTFSFASQRYALGIAQATMLGIIPVQGGVWGGHSAFMAGVYGILHRDNDTTVFVGNFDEVYNSHISKDDESEVDAIISANYVVTLTMNGYFEAMGDGMPGVCRAVCEHEYTVVVAGECAGYDVRPHRYNDDTKAWTLIDEDLSQGQYYGLINDGGTLWIGGQYEINGSPSTAAYLGGDGFVDASPSGLTEVLGFLVVDDVFYCYGRGVLGSDTVVRKRVGTTWVNVGDTSLTGVCQGLAAIPNGESHTIIASSESMEVDGDGCIAAEFNGTSWAVAVEVPAGSMSILASAYYADRLGKILVGGNTALAELDGANVRVPFIVERTGENDWGFPQIRGVNARVHVMG